MSDSDIYAGEKWSSEIGSELEETDFGIICVTPNNQTSPWLSFEAGALSKRVKSAKVVPYIFGMDLSDFGPGPLTQFHAKLSNFKDTREMLVSINQSISKPLETDRLSDIFDSMWPKLEDKLNTLMLNGNLKIEKRSLDSKVDKALSILRTNSSAGFKTIYDKLETISKY